MCGIAGAVALSVDARPDLERVKRMSCLLAHRGPDGEGLWTSPSGRACLAHRRLSVIDLATGQQPMTRADDALGIVFNGEIYNYRELRAALEARGERFRTDSDTEVLLTLFARKGAACVDDLRGMFAFAVWDERAGRLTLARDRVGKKPLYYVVEGGCLYFASSLKSLRETAAGRYEVDPESVDAFLTLGYVPAPRTIYRGVSKLEAATVMTVGLDGLHTERFWDLAPAAAPFDGDYEAAADRLDALLQEAVALRLRSDVPLGVFLSGGIDSSLVAAVAARQSPTTVRTFSIGMDDAAYDESEYAAEVARRVGTEHLLIRAHPDLLATLPSMVWHYGEPFADPSALPTWLLAQHTRQHVTVALGGDGGDEAFAGYSWYRTAAKLDRLTRTVPSHAFALAGRAMDGLLSNGGAWPAGGAGRLRRGLAMLGVARGGARFAALRSHLGSAEVDALYDGALRTAHDEHAATTGPAALLARLYGACSGSALRRMRYVDIRTYLADCLMPKVDVATMAHGLEARAPLLDHSVVEFALSLPDAWLVGPTGGKRILRTVLGRYLPTQLFERPKQGFDLPLHRWFAGPMRARVAALPASERLRDTGWIKASGVERLLREHDAGVRDHSQRLFSLLVLDEWLAGQ